MNYEVNRRGLSERKTRQAGRSIDEGLGWEPTSLKEIETSSGALGVEESQTGASWCLTVADMNLFQDNVIASEQFSWATTPIEKNVARQPGGET